MKHRATVDTTALTQGFEAYLQPRFLITRQFGRDVDGVEHVTPLGKHTQLLRNILAVPIQDD